MVWVVVSVILTFAFGTALAKTANITILPFLIFGWPVIWAVIQIYPQIVFVQEVSNGVMSALTYDREEWCCCSV